MEHPNPTADRAKCTFKKYFSGLILYNIQCMIHAFYVGSFSYGTALNLQHDGR